MTPSELISEGSSLMLFGMGFVFLFLTLLVLATGLMSNIINRFFQEPVSGSAPHSMHPATTKPADDLELVAAISAAIKMHRRKKTHKKNTVDYGRAMSWLAVWVYKNNCLIKRELLTLCLM